MNTSLWGDWEFLLGEWTGEGGGLRPGRGLGRLTFDFDLQGRVLVRRNHVDFPATTERPAFSHDDLMVIYQEPGGPIRAVYFDNEGHVIRYGAEVSQDGDRIVFLSDAPPTAPRFRLTHEKSPGGTLAIRFEIAPPGQPESFSIYTEGTVRRSPS